MRAPEPAATEAVFFRVGNHPNSRIFRDQVLPGVLADPSSPGSEFIQTRVVGPAVGATGKVKKVTLSEFYTLAAEPIVEFSNAAFKRRAWPQAFIESRKTAALESLESATHVQVRIGERMVGSLRVIVRVVEGPAAVNTPLWEISTLPVGQHLQIALPGPAWLDEEGRPSRMEIEFASFAMDPGLPLPVREKVRLELLLAGIGSIAGDARFSTIGLHSKIFTYGDRTSQRLYRSMGFTEFEEGERTDSFGISWKVLALDPAFLMRFVFEESQRLSSQRHTGIFQRVKEYVHAGLPGVVVVVPPQVLSNWILLEEGDSEFGDAVLRALMRHEDWEHQMRTVTQHSSDWRAVVRHQDRWDYYLKDFVPALFRLTSTSSQHESVRLRIAKLTRYAFRDYPEFREIFFDLMFDSSSKVRAVAMEVLRSRSLSSWAREHFVLDMYETGGAKGRSDFQEIMAISAARSEQFPKDLLERAAHSFHKYLNDDAFEAGFSEAAKALKMVRDFHSHDFTSYLLWPYAEFKS